MTAVNAGLHELAGLRLPLHPYSGGHAVFMYSTAADGNVTLQLKEPDDLDRSSLAAMIARLQDDATFSISYQDTDILSDGSIDVLLGSGTANSVVPGENDVVTGTFDLFDSSSGPDLTLSPQTFTNSAEAFINDNSNSLGVSTDTDPAPTSTTTSDEKKPSEAVKLTVKRPRPKTASPNRQGPQQCQVCAKVFGNASALAKHKLTHSDERKYVCTMCGKAFKRQDHLNGHMLTHRNKKPYECKAEGCGKSYCDARSLRRHTENHHSSGTTASSSAGVNTTTTTMSPAQGAASGDAASPHGSSCIQYAPAPAASSGNKSQLQQLLATEPAKSGNGGNNDGLTKQQLDLIHQIMEQTQRQSQSASKPTTKPATKPISKTPVKVQRIWTSTTTQTSSSNKGSGSPSPKVSTTTPSASPKPPPATEPKPVECNLCHRKFKNVPALNGHMRLHGGYFKKDADNKKCEKKDANNPPLQTASVSVRALIEEKIINKRNQPPAAPASAAPNDEKAAPPLYAELDAKLSSFAVPAPPEKARRHSDAAATTQQKAEALAELILKRSEQPKTVKRTTSDPGTQLIQFQAGESFTLAYQSDDGDYLAPSLQDEVFTQVQDSMLLPHSLASIQFQADNLEEYAAHAVNQELQAVLDSPLPESLAEFSTFHSSPGGYHQSQSPHASLTSQSPLQSPLTRHDSPGFAYPTPPASHEGQSPCFLGKSDFGHQIDRGFDEPPQASSPLSAAFFTSTMSSSAAVEEALEEVLPGETISSDDIYPLSNSPDSVGLTPVPSPLPEIISSPPSAPQNGGNTFGNYQGMLSNSDDPLLSSNPKDFVSKKINGVVPLKLLGGSSLVDLAGGNLTGILLDANGEIKLIQTGGGGGGNFAKNFILANTIIPVQEEDKVGYKVHKVLKTVQYTTVPTKQQIGRPNCSSKHIVELKKEAESGHDVFLSPRTVPPASPVKASRKRPRSELAAVPVLFPSKLRSVRHQAGAFTPQPMLNPARNGTGLFKVAEQECSPIPECDSTPHVNVGAQFQCKIPCFTSAPNRNTPEPIYEDLLWDPGIKKCTAKEVDMYLDFACCAAVPGGGRNKEYAMHQLHMCGGNIYDALLKLMQPTPALPKDHPLLSYQYSETEQWTATETETFQKAMLKHDKDFRCIAKEIGTKTIKQCIQFYYVWKKVCVEEYRKLKAQREKRHLHRQDGGDMEERILLTDAKILGILDGLPLPAQETRNFTCEFTDCLASFNSRAALNGHIRIHGGTARNSPTPSHEKCAKMAPSQVCHVDSTEDYPCKVCGKVFTKIKSRSAHMKSHRPPDAESSSKRNKDTTITLHSSSSSSSAAASYELSVPSPFNLV